MSTVAIGQHTAFADAVSANIRAECGRRRMSQAALARAIGMAPAAVSDRWRDRRQWQLDDIDRVAAVLGVPPGLLCAARDSNPEPSDLGSGVVVDLAAYRARVAA